MSRHLWGWAVFWVYSAVILGGSILPAENIPESISKINPMFLHAGEYFLLFFIAFHTFNHAHGGWLKSHSKRNAWLYCAAMGILTEALQFLAPGRVPEFGDWIIDVLGASMAILALPFLPFRGLKNT